MHFCVFSKCRDFLNHFTRFYELNLVPLPTTKFLFWNPNPQGDGIWKWGLWDMSRSWRWSLLNGISALKKETQRACFPCPSLSPSLFLFVTTMWGNQKRAHTRTQSWRHPDLGHSSFQNCEKWTPAGLWYFVTASRADWYTHCFFHAHASPTGGQRKVNRKCYLLFSSFIPVNLKLSGT